MVVTVVVVLELMVVVGLFQWWGWVRAEQGGTTTASSPW